MREALLILKDFDRSPFSQFCFDSYLVDTSQYAELQSMCIVFCWLWLVGIFKLNTLSLPDYEVCEYGVFYPSSPTGHPEAGDQRTSRRYARL